MGGAGESSVATLDDDSARGVVEEGKGPNVSLSGDGGGNGPKSGFICTPSLHDVIGPVGNDSGEAAHLVLEGTSAGGDSNRAATMRNLSTNMTKQVSTGSGRWSKAVGKEKCIGQPNWRDRGS